MPISSAITMAGIGNTTATHGAAATASAPTAADSNVPGRMARSQAKACDARVVDTGRLVIGKGALGLESLGLECGASALYGIAVASKEVANRPAWRA